MVLEIPTSHAYVELPRQPKTTNTGVGAHKHSANRHTQVSVIYFILYQLLETNAANGDADSSKYVHHIKLKVGYTVSVYTPPPTHPSPYTQHRHTHENPVLLRYQNKGNNSETVGSSTIMREVYTKKKSTRCDREGEGERTRADEPDRKEKGDGALANERVNNPT